MGLAVEKIIIIDGNKVNGTLWLNNLTVTGNFIVNSDDSVTFQPKGPDRRQIAQISKFSV